MAIVEQNIADFSGGYNGSADLSKVPDRECILAENCSFDELGNVQAAGGATKQNSVAYADSGNTNVHSLYLNPTIRHLAGVGNDVFEGTALGSLAVKNNEAQSGTLKMTFAESRRYVFYEAGSTARCIDATGASVTVDWPNPTTPAATGPSSGGTFATVANGSGLGIAWTNPANIASSNDVYATCTPTTGQSDYLRATNFGFAVAGSPTVLGIVVEVEVAYSGGNSSTIERLLCTLIKTGSPHGSSFLNLATGATLAEGYVTFGASDNLWGGTWTVADINASTFGVQFFTINDQGGLVAYSVDHIRITVYTASGGVAIAVGAAGNPNGTYTWKVTFADADGNESEASPASASQALASQIGSLSAIPVGDGRTTKRYVYRKGGSLTFYYRVGEVSDNATTTFSDNYSDATALTDGILLAGEVEGDRPNTRLGSTTTVKYPTLHFSRLFWASQETDKTNRIVWSKVSAPFAYPSGLYFDVGDAKPITRIVPFLDDLIIFKEDSIWRLSGNTESAFQLTRTPATVGCDMPFTVVKLQDRIMFTNSQGVWFFDGVTARPATNRLDLFFLGQTRNGVSPIVVNDTTKILAEATVSQGRYYLAYSTNGTSNGRIAVLDLDGGTISFRTVAALCLASDPVTGDVYYGDSSGFVKTLDDLTATNDATASVAWAFQTKFYDQKRGSNKSYVGLELEIDTSGQSVTPTVYFDSNVSSGTALSAVSTSSRDMVYVPILASAARKARSISIKFSATLTTVNESNAPAVTLYGGKLYIEELKQRSRTTVG